MAGGDRNPLLVPCKAGKVRDGVGGLQGDVTLPSDSVTKEQLKLRGNKCRVVHTGKRKQS